MGRVLKYVFNYDCLHKKYKLKTNQHHLPPPRIPLLRGSVGHHKFNDFATSFLHFTLFSSALWDLVNSRPVLSLMLSSHLFSCLLCVFFCLPFTEPCKMVSARPGGDMFISLQFASLYDSEVFVWSDCLLDLGKCLYLTIIRPGVQWTTN